MLTRQPRVRSTFGDVLPDADGIIRLRKGDVGPEVEDWQNNLLMAGYSLGVTGTFDSATFDATMQFQAAHGVKATGIADAPTRAALADYLDSMSLPGSSRDPNFPPPAPITPPPLEIKGRFPSAWWLLVPLAVGVALKKKRK